MQTENTSIDKPIAKRDNSIKDIYQSKNKVNKYIKLYQNKSNNFYKIKKTWSGETGTGLNISDRQTTLITLSCIEKFTFHKPLYKTQFLLTTIN